ncbi:hypothetical protein PSR63_15570 [Bremerella sp. P1]|nr:hypothetical protein [Bremerella sp. P1]WDI39905.1 hypothetical protein PSR63_15570 [Bremerella sp. P1]
MKCRGNSVKNSLQVHINHLVPLVCLELFQRGQGHEACVVQHDINSTERFHCLVDELLDLLEVGNVGGDRQGIFTKLFGQRLNAIGATGSQDDFGSFRGKQSSGCFAQATAGPGDDDNFVLNVLT